ncbi:MAG: hypothetical protein RI894_927 [Bacteroidota bacterium]|jgi:hypothetical protein
MKKNILHIVLVSIVLNCVLLSSVQAQGFEGKHSYLSGGLALVPGAGAFAQYEYAINDHKQCYPRFYL